MAKQLVFFQYFGSQDIYAVDIVAKACNPITLGLKENSSPQIA